MSIGFGSTAACGKCGQYYIGTYLVLGESHLDDAVAVVAQVERVRVVGLPPVEVGRVLAVAIAGGDPGEELLRAATGHLI
jgi:hypothetical protein